MQSYLFIALVHHLACHPPGYFCKTQKYFWKFNLVQYCQMLLVEHKLENIVHFANIHEQYGNKAFPICTRHPGTGIVLHRLCPRWWFRPVDQRHASEHSGPVPYRHSSHWSNAIHATILQWSTHCYDLPDAQVSHPSCTMSGWRLLWEYLGQSFHSTSHGLTLIRTSCVSVQYWE